MKTEDLQKLAKEYFILDDGLGETNLIRRIQCAAGHLDCFATPRFWTCRELDCMWRDECAQKAAESAAPTKRP